MEKIDYSREIFEKYYNKENRILKIILKDDTVLNGIFISFFHGEENSKEPYIIKWHFLDEKDISKQDIQLSIDGSEEYGKIIKQEDIKSVEFKV